MTKLIRCPAGHVYDKDAHDSCPECARITSEEGKEETKEAASGATPSESEATSVAKSGTPAIPVTWVAAGAAGLLAVAALGFFLFTPKQEPTPIIHKKVAVTTTPPKKKASSGAPASAGTDNSAKASSAKASSANASSANASSANASSANASSASAPIETAADANKDPDFQTCIKGSGNAALDACTKTIESGRFAKGNLELLYTRRAILLMGLQNIDAALKDIDEVIKLDPQSASAYSEKCDFLRTKGQLAEALAACNQAIQLAPKDGLTYLGRGVVFKAKGDLDLALKDDNQAVALMPDNALALTLRGQVLQAKGEWDNAKADFEKALTLNPKPQAKTMIEAAMKAVPPAQKPSAAAEPKKTLSAKIPDPDYQTCAKDSDEAALDACSRAIQSKKFSGPDLGRLYDYRANVATALAKGPTDKRYDDAIADYSEAIKLWPDNFYPLAGRAETYATKGESKLAIQDLNKAIEMKPDEAGLYNNRGLNYRKSGNLDAALDDLNHAIELDPKLLFAYWNRGDVYRFKGDAQKAVADYKKALSLNPSPGLTKTLQGLISLVEEKSNTASQATSATSSSSSSSAPAAETGNPKTDPDYVACHDARKPAMDACDRAIASGKFTGKDLAALYVSRGTQDLLKANGKTHADAIADFGQAAAIDPSNKDALFDRGEVYLQDGKYDQAIADLEKSIQVDQKNRDAYWSLGDAYKATGKFDKARDNLQRALTLTTSEDDRTQIASDLTVVHSMASGKIPAPPKPSPAPPVKPQSSVPSEGSTTDAKTDKDYQLCARAKDYQGLIDDCGRAINSGKWKADELAALYYQRATGYEERGRVMNVQGDFDDAIDAANQAIKLSPRTETYALRGDIYTDEKKYAEAEEDYQKALSFNPNAQERKDIQDKLASAQKSVTLAPDKDSLATNQERKDIQAKIASAQKSIALEPDKNSLAANQEHKDIMAKIAEAQKRLAPGPDKSNPATNTSSKPATSQPANTPAAQPSGAEANPDSDKDYQTCYKDKDEVAAEDACTRAIKSGKWSGRDLATLYYNRANFRADYEDFEDALSDAAEAIKLAPEPDTYQLHGEIYDAMDEYGKAIDDYRKALSLNPSDKERKEIQSELDTALQLSKTGKKSENTTQPINKSGSNPQSQANPSGAAADSAKESDYQACVSEKDENKKIDACTTAIASGKWSGSELGTLYLLRAIAYTKQKKTDAALADVNESITLNPVMEDYELRGDLYGGREDYDKAIADFREALTFNPSGETKKEIQTNLDLMLQAAKTAPKRASGAESPTSSPTQASAPASPSPFQVSADPETNASNCFSYSGDAAIAACSAAILSKQFTGPKLGDLYSARCFVRGQSGDLDGALADCNHAINLAPDHGSGYSNRGIAYYARGQFDLAMADLNKAIQMLPTDGLYYNNRGVVYMHEGKLDQALQDFNKAIQYDPTYAKAYRNRADIEQASSNVEAAKDDLNKALSLTKDEKDRQKLQALLSTVEAGKVVPIKQPPVIQKPTGSALLNPVLPAAEAWDDKYCGKGKVLFKDDFKTLNPSWNFADYPNREIGSDGLSYDVAPGQGVIILNSMPHGPDYEVCALIQNAAPEYSLTLLGLNIWANSINDLYSVLVSPSFGGFLVTYAKAPRTFTTIISSKHDPAVKQGMQATNAVSVTVRGNQGTVAINGQVAGSFAGQVPANGGEFGFSFFTNKKDVGSSTYTIKGFELREAAPLTAQTGSNSVQFCNHFTATLWFALAYPTDQGWKSQGWAHVQPNACQTMGQLPDFKTFYYRAETDPRHHGWEWGKVRSFSVKASSNFSFENANLDQRGRKFLTFGGPIPNPAPSTVTIDIDQNKRVAVITTK